MVLGLKTEKKSSKINIKRIEPNTNESVYVTAKARRFITAYDKLNATIRKRFNIDGDAVSAYVGRLGSVGNASYRDELMIRLVRCREIRNKFTLGQIYEGNAVVSDEDISSLLSLEKRVFRLTDPVSCHERGEMVSKFRRYSRAVMSILSLFTITALAIALFFAIKY